MRTGNAGLAALYWPTTLGTGLKNHPEVDFVAASRSALQRPARSRGSHSLHGKPPKGIAVWTSTSRRSESGRSK